MYISTAMYNGYECYCPSTYGISSGLSSDSTCNRYCYDKSTERCGSTNYHSMVYELGEYKCEIAGKDPSYRYNRSGMVNSNTVNSRYHLIQSYCEIFFYHFPNISCLKCTVNSNFHFIRSKTLPTNDFELTVSNLYLERNSRYNKY